MKTDDLVTMLATGAGAVEPNAAARRYGAALGWGAFGATLLMAIVLGVRIDLARAILLPMFWAKLAFAGSLVAASLLIAMRLSQPGARLGWAPRALMAPLLVMWALAAIALFNADPALWPQLFFGKTWRSCPFRIAALSAPMLIAVLWAMKGLAPTRLRLAGAAAGFFSGTAGALVYSLHCYEMEARFIGFWDVIGMLIPAAAGALLGPRLLRW